MSRVGKNQSIARALGRTSWIRPGKAGRNSKRQAVLLEALEQRLVMTMPGFDPGSDPLLPGPGDPPVAIVAPQPDPPAPPAQGPIGGNPLPPKPENDPSRPVPSRTEVVAAVQTQGGYDSLIQWATGTPAGRKMVDWANSFRLFDEGGSRLVVLKLNGEQDPQPVLDQLNAQQFVNWAAPNLTYPAGSGFDPRDFVPNDPQYPTQWHHPRMGNTQAWDIATTMGAGMRIAVLDDGVKLTHEDLAANIWVNGGEVPGNGIDDDSNGYVDDLNGWDFSANDNNPNPAGDGSHGTPVAGSAAAVTNNAIGVAGVAGRAKILPVRFYGTGAWTSVVIAQSYAYSAYNGARIMNVSYNIDGFATDPIFAAASSFAYDAGVLYLNSAGNNNQLNPVRTVYDQALFVAATGTTDVKMSYSNFGVAVDISAPADPLYTTSDATAGGGYEAFSGTSAATPVASGAFALVWGQRPTWTRDQVVAQVLGTADNIDGVNPLHAGLLGYGRINTYRALTETIAAPKFGAITGLPAEGGTSTRPIGSFTIRNRSIYAQSSIVPGSFQMQYAGPDRTFGTADDAALPLDVQALNGGTYKIGTNDLKFSVGGSMIPGLYRFIARSGANGVKDPFGTQLDGNGDGTAGDDLVRNFEVVYQAGGVVYREDNRDGVRQATESGLGGWTMFFDANGNGLLDTVAMPTQVATNVPVAIADMATVGSNMVVAGATGGITDVNVRINITHTWNSDLVISLIAPSGQRVVLSKNLGGSGDNFTNTLFDDSAANPINSGTSPFSGTFRPFEPLSLFNGQSPNGTWRLEVQDTATGDVGSIVGWSLDIRYATEQSFTTAADGTWVASGLPVGDYALKLIASPSDWAFFSPPTGLRTFSLPTASSSVGGIDFAVVGRPTLSATVDAAPFASGDTIFFSAILGTTSAPKFVTIMNSGPGTAYFTGSSLPPEFEIVGSLPAMLLPGKMHVFQLQYDGSNPMDVSGQLRIGYANPINSTDFVFELRGDTIAPSFSGRAMNDLNGNGTLDTGESAFAGVGLYADKNNNGSFTPGTVRAFAATGLPANLVDAGTFTKTVSVTGLTGPVEDVTLLVNLTHTWIEDLVVTLISPTGVRTMLFNQRGGNLDNMTNTIFDDAASLPISAGSAPFTGTFRPEEPLSRFDGLQGNGTWTLEIVDVFGADTGQLLAFELRITSGGEPVTFTDAQGLYNFYDLPSGTPLSIRLLAAPPAGHTVVSPPGGVFATTLAPSQYVPLDYIILPTNSISGQVTDVDTGDGLGRVRIFNDRNGNGQFDFTPVQSSSSTAASRIRDMSNLTKTVTVSGSTLPVQGVEVIVNIAHTHVGDLRITLISPAGTQVILHNRAGGNSQHLRNVRFDEYAESAVPGGTNLTGGTYRPSQSLAPFYNTNPNGTWTLRVEDMAYGDVGTYFGFALRLITTQEATTVTNNLGYYTMASAMAGNYALMAAPLEPGWVTVTPGSGVLNPTLVSNSALNGQNFVLERGMSITGFRNQGLVSNRAGSGGRTDAFGVTYDMIAVPPLALVSEVAKAGKPGSKTSGRRINDF